MKSELGMLVPPADMFAEEYEEKEELKTSMLDRKMGLKASKKKGEEAPKK